MKDKFVQLLREIESEIFDQALRLQLNRVDNLAVNDDYALGYRAALLSLLGKARNIERQRTADRYIPTIYAAASTEFERFCRAFEQFAITGKIEKRET